MQRHLDGRGAENVGVCALDSQLAAGVCSELGHHNAKSFRIQGEGFAGEDDGFGVNNINGGGYGVGKFVGALVEDLSGKRVGVGELD